MSDSIAPLLLLRGLTREARHWRDLPRHLGEQLPDARIRCLDLPGNGALAHEASPWRMADYVTACRQQVADCQLDGPLHLVALSLGGMVALDWAHRHPEQVASCVLINTSFRPLAPLHWRLRPRALATLAHAMTTGDLAARERDILRLTSRRYSPDDAPGAIIADEWVALQRDAPVSRLNALRQLLAAARFTCPKPPGVPLLLLASTHDQLVDVRCSRAVATRWGCPLHEHGSAGHDLALDDPAWLIQEVAGWLAASRLPSPRTSL